MRIDTTIMLITIQLCTISSFFLYALLFFSSSCLRLFIGNSVKRGEEEGNFV
jgi:hypothetical protein